MTVKEFVENLNMYLLAPGSSSEEERAQYNRGINILDGYHRITINKKPMSRDIDFSYRGYREDETKEEKANNMFETEENALACNGMR